MHWTRSLIATSYNSPRQSRGDPMAASNLRDVLRTQLSEIEQQGLTKRERQIESPQSARIRVNGRDVINFCANNYLGLANNPEIAEAGHEAMRKYGYGLSSV